MHWRSAVEAAEVLLHQINGLVYALFDRNGRHDDNELGKAISLVQLKNGAQIHVCFACSRFHLYGEIEFSEAL